MRHDPVPNELFASRRRNFMRQMQKGSIALFFSNDLMPRSGDQYFPYRQDSALYALSGIEQEGTILMLFPSAKNKSFRELVFLLPRKRQQAIWDGQRLSQKEASGISGIKTILSTDQFKRTGDALIREARSIYVNTPEIGRPVSVNSERNLIELRKTFPDRKIIPAYTILRKSMMIKHPLEIKLIRKAISVSNLAFHRVLQMVKPGMMEYEIEAELTYMLTRHGCRHAFEPIIASGRSACTLHYITNDKPVKPGSLILLDFGAEHAMMASDISRTIPANGRYSPEQRKLYLAVHRVLNEVTAMMRPGVMLTDLNRETGKLIESELTSLKLLSKKDIRRQSSGQPLWKKYFMHGVSHHLGYDVHDVSDRTAALRAGMVLTCEPGLYVRELGTGIRLENDILISANGPVNLSADIPVDAEEIESLMESKT